MKADDPAAPVMLYLHGARWNLSGSVTRIDRWRKLGFSVLAVDYRGFGKSSEIAPSEASAYEDAEAAWDYLAKIAPGRRRYIVGHSLGGAIAVELARRHPDAAGLVLEATFTSVRDMIDQSPWGFLPVGLILTQKFDALSRIGQVKVPVLVTTARATRWCRSSWASASTTPPTRPRNSSGSRAPGTTTCPVPRLTSTARPSKSYSS